MSSLRPVGRSAATLVKDRVSLCRFTFADGRQCRTPRSPNHPHFCFDRARKESQARSANKLARELSYFLSGEYLSANDLGAALGPALPPHSLPPPAPTPTQRQSTNDQSHQPSLPPSSSAHLHSYTFALLHSPCSP
jgi:hypothetical protein